MRENQAEQIDWISRWSDNRIGFHQQKINSRLVRLWPTLGLEQGSTVFVPLCGKSLDMIWLGESGHRILGIELSEIACRDFFVENNIDFHRSASEKFEIYSGGPYTLLQGDLFDLSSSDLIDVEAIYDRASLIALPPVHREAYARHLSAILPVDTKMLLISMDYDETKMQGPPFSVPQSEVTQLFENSFDVKLVAESSGPDIVGNLAERGLDTLNEKVYFLQNR